MPVDTNIPHGEPGRASFASETFGGSGEPRFGDAPAQTKTINVGASVDLPLYSVVSYDGTTIALADQVAPDAWGILAARVLTGVGESTTVDVYVSGHWNMDALNWDASFDTDAKKEAAFRYANSPNPTVLISKPKFEDANVIV